jgi:hypothetical protein
VPRNSRRSVAVAEVDRPAGDAMSTAHFIVASAFATNCQEDLRQVFRKEYIFDTKAINKLLDKFWNTL